MARIRAAPDRGPAGYRRRFTRHATWLEHGIYRRQSRHADEFRRGLDVRHHNVYASRDIHRRCFQIEGLQ